MLQPELNAVYVIELCSGERRRWCYLAQSGNGEGAWWRDEDSRAEFSEASLMYVWRILGKEDQR